MRTRLEQAAEDYREAMETLQAHDRKVDLLDQQIASLKKDRDALASHERREPLEAAMFRAWHDLEYAIRGDEACRTGRCHHKRKDP